MGRNIPRSLLAPAPRPRWELIAGVLLQLAVAACSHGSVGPGPPAAPGAGADAGSGDGQGPSTDAGLQSPDAGQLACSGAGIAAFADRLVNAGRKSCTSHGVGVVKQDNYTCMQAPINTLSPPYKDASYNVISTLLANNTQWPFLECTYFVQAVTAGVCGAPISPPSKVWQSYPLAAEFSNSQIPGYLWIDKAQGGVQRGDIFVDDSYSPGHIMIVAELLDSTHFRFAEANVLHPDGTAASNVETGVVSNTRVGTLDDTGLAGWYRRTGGAQAPPASPSGQPKGSCNNPCWWYGMYEGECRSDRYGSYLCKNGCSTIVSSCPP